MAGHNKCGDDQRRIDEHTMVILRAIHLCPGCVDDRDIDGLTGINDSTYIMETMAGWKISDDHTKCGCTDEHIYT